MSGPYYVNVSYWYEVVVIDKDGSFVTGLPVTYELRKSSDGSLVSSGAMVSDGNAYKVQLNITTVGQYRLLYFTPNKYENGILNIQVEVDRIAILNANLAAVKADVAFIKQMTSGRWKLDENLNQMIFYAEDNVTEIARFNMFDNTGAPSVDVIAERVKV